MSKLELLSYLIASGQLTATLLIGPWIRGTYAKPIGWAILGTTHVTLIAFGWTGDFGGFKYLQPLMIPLTLFNFVMAMRSLQKEAVVEQRHEESSTTRAGGYFRPNR